MTERLVKQVIVVRKDLNMRKGKMVAQGGHSVLQFICHANKSTDPSQMIVPLTEPEIIWFSNFFPKIAVSCASENELMFLMEKAKQAGVKVYPIIDNGVTEFKGVKTLTCAAFGPDYIDVLDPITGKQPLL